LHSLALSQGNSKGCPMLHICYHIMSRTLSSNCKEVTASECFCCDIAMTIQSTKVTVEKSGPLCQYTTLGKFLLFVTLQWTYLYFPFIRICLSRICFQIFLHDLKARMLLMHNGFYRAVPPKLFRNYAP